MSYHLGKAEMGIPGSFLTLCSLPWNTAKSPGREGPKTRQSGWVLGRLPVCRATG